MKNLLLLLTLFVVSTVATIQAQRDSVSVEIDPGEVCPTGWATVDATVAHAERIFYVLPSSLVDAFHDTHIGGGFAEFLVSDAFVAAVFPTADQQQAAYTSGRLRAESATSGSTRTCTLGS